MYIRVPSEIGEGGVHEGPSSPGAFGSTKRQEGVITARYRYVRGEGRGEGALKARFGGEVVRWREEKGS